MEVAVCEAWAELGRVPAEAVKTIRDKADIDVERILTIEETTRHDVIAFLTSLEEKVGPEARFIHLGCTSSDIVDTANALLLVQAGELILKDLRALLETLEDLARRHKGVLCMGRTHGIHAEPTSFGLKMAGFTRNSRATSNGWKRAWKACAWAKSPARWARMPSFRRSWSRRPSAVWVSRWTRTPPRSSSATATPIFHFPGDHGRGRGAALRGAAPPPAHRSAGSGRRFRQGPEGLFGHAAQKESHFRRNMSGLSRLLRSNALAALENQALWHERDISHSSVERVIMPDSTILADYVLTRLARLLSGLVVKPERMCENMERSFGLYFSQRVLTALIAAGLPRQQAYEAVQRLAMQSWETRRPFPDLVRENADMRARLGEAALAELFDPAYYLQHEDAVFTRVFSADAAEN